MSGLTLVLALAAAPSGQGALLAAATASTRPPECVTAASSQQPEFWSRARGAERGPYCWALARAHTRLASTPQQALELAEQALALSPQSRAAAVLRARALVRLGRGREAWSGVARLLGDQGRAGQLAQIDDPLALRDLAAAALLAGAEEQAHELFKVVAARTSLLPDGRARMTALLEAGVLALSRGPLFLPEAELYLDEARRAEVPGFRDLVLGFTALALDRAGHAEQSRAAAREVSGPWELERRHTAESRAAFPSIVLPSGELDAAIAILAEGRDAPLAEARWRAYLADGRASQGPWAEHARSKLGAGRPPSRSRAGG